MPTVRLIIGDVRDVMSSMIADGDTYDLLVTSPPFLALRSYLPADHVDKAREIGSEATPATFLDTLYGLTADWGRLLPEWASICVELGDTMSGSGGAGGDYNLDGLREGQPTWESPSARAAATTSTTKPATGTTKASERRSTIDGSAAARTPLTTTSLPRDTRNRSNARKGYGGAADRVDALKPGTKSRMAAGPGWPLAKSMCILPHAYTLGLAYGFNPLRRPMTAAAFIKLVDELVEAGMTIPEAYGTVREGIEIEDNAFTFDPWRIRNVITWARRNPPVGSLGKRNPAKRTGDYKFRPACSYITVACRGTGRYFDLDAVRTEGTRNAGHVPEQANGSIQPGNTNRWRGGVMTSNPAGAPPLDWHTDRLDGDWLWKLATAPYPGAHYATYPLTLPRRLILAMCPESVCTVCGWPRERVTGETTYARTDSDVIPARLAQTNGQRIAPGVNQHHQSDGANTSVVAQRPTLGFTDCGHDNYRSGRVLDPFAGSGTTAVAAALEGRDCTLIDLDPRNVDLIDRRLREALHVTSRKLSKPRPRTKEEGRGGRTPHYTSVDCYGKSHKRPLPASHINMWTDITWTVEAPLPDQKAQVDGQANLFDLEPVTVEPGPTDDDDTYTGEGTPRYRPGYLVNDGRTMPNMNPKAYGKKPGRGRKAP